MKQNTAGFTLIEMAVTCTFVCVLFGSLITAVQSASDSFATGVVAADVGARSERTVHQLCELLKYANPETMSPKPAAPFSATKVTFQRLADYQEGTKVWGETESLSLVDGRILWITAPGSKTQNVRVLCTGIATSLQGETPKNAKDDNGNGLIDEGGLSFEFRGNRVTVRVTVESHDVKKTRIVRTVQKTVYFRY